uniref:EF-hand domain-containing protein n=1 Tax=Heterorhabditis bacteriophora TaxID=37862 RepID=A0A1I7WT42_HETBA
MAQMLVDFGYDVSPKVIQAVIRSSDKSGDGEIDFGEFLSAITSKYKKLKKDGDGLVSTEELSAWSETFKLRTTIREAATFIQKIDKGDQKRVTIGDFITVCQTV